MRIPTTILLCILTMTISVAWGVKGVGVSAAETVRREEAVILLHGLGRTSGSMNMLRKRLTRHGYHVVNLPYSSRKMSIEKISSKILAPVVREMSKRFETVHFVTHSMGGIVVRYYLNVNDTSRVGRVVMLAPPNKGSELIDFFASGKLFQRVMGPASLQLSTHSPLLADTPMPPVEIGVIAGDVSCNPVTSLLVKGVDDGKVSVENTRYTGIKEHIVIHSNHTLIMRNSLAIKQILHFLSWGRFFS